VAYLGRLSLPLYLNQNLAIIIGKAYLRPGFSDVMLVITIVAMDFAFSAFCLWTGAKLTEKFNRSKLNRIVLGIE